MSGATRRVQARLLDLSGGRALYVHCSAHKLNLAVVGAIRHVGRSADLFQQLQQLYGYLSTSVVHSKYEELRGSTNRLQMQRLSDTRWVCQAAACHNARVNLGVVVGTLSYYMDSLVHADGERRAQARGLMAFIDTAWAMELCIMEEVLTKLKHLHLVLQGSELDLAAATVMIEATIAYSASEFAALSQPGGTSEGWRAVWAKFTSVLEEMNIPQPRARPVRRVRHDAAAVATVVLDTEDDYKKHLYVPIVTAVEGELRRRFEGWTNLAFTGIDALCPTSSHFLSLERLRHFALHYLIDMDILRHDIATYRIMTAGFVARDPEFVHPKCLSDLINMLTPYRMAVPALLEIATIAITIPVGTAGCERVFSVMKRVKTWLRCQTTDDRLSDLAILAVHRKRAKELGANNWGRVVQRFKEDSHRVDILL